MVSTYPDYGSSSIINKPSDGTPGRWHAVFLLSNLSPTHQPGSLLCDSKSLTPSPRGHHPVHRLRHGHRLVPHG